MISQRNNLAEFYALLHHEAEKLRQMMGTPTRVETLASDTRAGAENQPPESGRRFDSTNVCTIMQAEE